METASVRAGRLPADLGDIQRLCWAYRDHLLAYDDQVRRLAEFYYPTDEYAALMDAMAEKYAAPGHGIVLAARGDLALGCGMYHPLNADDAEIKRVFVTPEGRGMGLGHDISQALIDAVRADGYRRVLLDTNRVFAPARRLYEKLGFRPCGPYSDIPPDVAAQLVFYELIL